LKLLAILRRSVPTSSGTASLRADDLSPRELTYPYKRAASLLITLSETCVLRQMQRAGALQPAHCRSIVRTNVQDELRGDSCMLWTDTPFSALIPLIKSSLVSAHQAVLCDGTPNDPGGPQRLRGRVTVDGPLATFAQWTAAFPSRGPAQPVNGYALAFCCREGQMYGGPPHCAAQHTLAVALGDCSPYQDPSG